MASVTDLPAGADSNEAFAIEQNGINLIPDSERKSAPIDMAWVFAGANLVFINAISGSLCRHLGPELFRKCWPSCC